MTSLDEMKQIFLASKPSWLDVKKNPGVPTTFSEVYERDSSSADRLLQAHGWSRKTYLNAILEQRKQNARNTQTKI